MLPYVNPGISNTPGNEPEKTLTLELELDPVTLLAQDEVIGYNPPVTNVALVPEDPAAPVAPFAPDVPEVPDDPATPFIPEVHDVPEVPPPPFNA